MSTLHHHLPTFFVSSFHFWCLNCLNIPHLVTSPLFTPIDLYLFEFDPDSASPYHADDDSVAFEMCKEDLLLIIAIQIHLLGHLLSAVHQLMVLVHIVAKGKR